jgi:hypothetical protein
LCQPSWAEGFSFSVDFLYIPKPVRLATNLSTELTLIALILKNSKNVLSFDVWLHNIP